MRLQDNLEIELKLSVTGDDPDALLDAARARGSVVRFAPVQATLAELFREAVEA